jgi:hypothetical protein
LKKFLFAFLLIGGIIRFGHAAITDPQVNQEKTVQVYLSTTIPVATNPARFVLIQLSSSSYPHLALNPSDIGEIDISHIRADIDKVATSSGSIRIGVVTYTDTHGGSVEFFWKRSFTKNGSNTNISDPENDTPAFYRCKVRVPVSSTTYAGPTPWILSNETLYNVSAYTSTATFQSTVGVTSSLRTGDIVMEIANLDPANTIVVNTTVLYHAEP